MLDPQRTVISPSDWQPGFYNRMLRELPVDFRLQLNSVFRSYWLAYGIEGVQERFNGRTVVQILAEYQPPSSEVVIASGERQGMRYTVYEANDSRERNA
jgi:hypothetical protein